MQAKVKSPVSVYEYFKGVPMYCFCPGHFDRRHFSVTVGAAGFLCRRKKLRGTKSNSQGPLSNQEIQFRIYSDWSSIKNKYFSLVCQFCKYSPVLVNRRSAHSGSFLKHS